MPKHTQPLWRTRRNAIDKKGALDVELLQDTETIVMSRKRPEMPTRPMHSPTSILQVPEMLPEMQALILPGAWVEVGKRGKPIINTKMYELPVVAKKKKKRTRKAEAVPESIWALEEAPASSKCLQVLHTATSYHEKAATLGRTVKYWTRYRQQHALKIQARDALLASAMFSDEDDALEECAALTTLTARHSQLAARRSPLTLTAHPHRTPLTLTLRRASLGVPAPTKRDNKKLGARDKARRLARDAKAEYAFWPAELDEPAESTELPAAATETSLPTVTPQMSVSKRSLPTGWWSVVGKHGKTVKFERPSKRRPRTRKAEAVPESIWALEEAPAPSKCLQALHTAMSRHEKAATRGRTVKYWTRHKLEWQAKIQARDALLASPMFSDEGDALEECAALTTLAARHSQLAARRSPLTLTAHPHRTPLTLTLRRASLGVPAPTKRDNKKLGARDKARRLARDAKAEYAFWPAELDEPAESTELPAAATETSLPTVTPQMSVSKRSLPTGWWSVVGKHGKTVKFERPSKRRPRTRKAEAVPESIWALEEAPAPSKCLQALHTAMSRHEKAATRGRTVKYWTRHKLEWQAKIQARDALLASPMFSEEGDEPGRLIVTLSMFNAPEPMKKRDNKKRGAHHKARRHARDAKDRLCCYWAEDKNGSMPTVEAVIEERAVPSPKPSSPASPFVVVQPPSLPTDGSGQVALSADIQEAEASGSCVIS